MRNYRSFNPVAGAALLLVAAHGLAFAGEITPDLKQEVMSNCASDAYRLCPQSLTSLSEAAACMRHKRAELLPVCRASFDRAVRVLAQK